MCEFSSLHNASIEIILLDVNLYLLNIHVFICRCLVSTQAHIDGVCRCIGQLHAEPRRRVQLAALGTLGLRAVSIPQGNIAHSTVAEELVARNETGLGVIGSCVARTVRTSCKGPNVLPLCRVCQGDTIHVVFKTPATEVGEAVWSPNRVCTDSPTDSLIGPAEDWVGHQTARGTCVGGTTAGPDRIGVATPPTGRDTAGKGPSCQG